MTDRMDKPWSKMQYSKETRDGPSGHAHCNVADNGRADCLAYACYLNSTQERLRWRSGRKGMMREMMADDAGVGVPGHGCGSDKPCRCRIVCSRRLWHAARLRDIDVVAPHVVQQDGDHGVPLPQPPPTPKRVRSVLSRRSVSGMSLMPVSARVNR
jgi:hypothetical protein